MVVYVLIGAVLMAGLALGFGVWKFGLWKLVWRQPAERTGTLAWEDLGPTPLGENRFTPQGMTCVRGDIVFANTWKNTRSRVYRYKPPRMDNILGTFDMPKEAVHTSGLAFDGQYLWAVDYISNRCYKLALEESFAQGEAQVVGSFDTGLGGTSACCFLEYEGRKCMAISDFMRTSRTYLVRHEEALKAGRMQGAAIFSYVNEGFSQGLEWDGQYLYESENKRGVDVVNRMDLAELARTGSARQATVRQFRAGAEGVEDLAWDGEFLYTSDESTFRFYRCRLR
jgi:glutamine cyclotransferase